MQAPNGTCPICGDESPTVVAGNPKSALCGYCEWAAAKCSDIAETWRETEAAEELLRIASQDPVSHLPDVPVGKGGRTGSVEEEAASSHRMDCGSGGSSVGGQASPSLFEDGYPCKRVCRGLSRSDGRGDGEDVPWQLPLVQEPQIGSTILYEGKQLHIEHGSDGDSEGDLEASESLSEGGEDQGSDYSSGDEGTIDDARDYIARWDCWKQTVFDRQEWPDLSLFFQ